MTDNVPADSDPGDLSPEASAAIDGAFETLDLHLLPILESAGTDDGRGRARMGERSEPFVGKIRDYLVTNPEFMPPYADTPAFQRAVKKIDALRPYQRRFDQYKSLVDDTVGNAGSDALEAGAHPYYKTVAEAAKYKQPAAVTIYEDLSSRYARRRSPKKTAAPAAKKPPADSSPDKD